MTKPRLLIEGMHGLGDNLHQRGLLRQLMPRYEIWLQTSWASPYYDLIEQGLNVVNKRTSLRTQTKNAEREKHLFKVNQPYCEKMIKVWYTPQDVRRAGTFLGGMCLKTGLDIRKADFSLRAKPEWITEASERIGHPAKPVLFFRPLVERTEWGGCRNRNPDINAYRTIVDNLRDDFFVVSIADLEPGKEWLADPTPFTADRTFHRGELTFEAMAGLMALSSAALVSPGFALILAQALHTPCIAVFGGHESGRFYDHGGVLGGPYKAIEPEHPCECFSNTHACNKHINVNDAINSVRRFLEMKHRTRTKALPTEHILCDVIDWRDMPKRFMNPGEVETICELLRRVEAKSVLEIGVNEGRTARLILDNVPSIAAYVGIDVLPGYTFEKAVQRNELPESPGRYAKDDPRFTLRVSRRGSFDFLPSDLGQFDAVFIDGDHSRRAVQHDTALARAVKPKIIIWHDYHTLGTVDVRPVLHEYFDAGHDIRHASGTWLAYQITERGKA